MGTAVPSAGAAEAKGSQKFERTEVEVEVLGGEFELLPDVADRSLDLHQRRSDRLRFGAADCLLFHPPNCLPFHQLSDELDEREHQLDDGALYFPLVGIPTHGGLLPHLLVNCAELLVTDDVEGSRGTAAFSA